MNKIILFTILALFTGTGLAGQEFVQVATGEGYAHMVFYSLADDGEVEIAMDAWDLAFSAAGTTDVGISVNEGTASITGAPAAELIVYGTDSGDFAEVTDTTAFTGRLLNDESSWERGALNSVADPDDPFDFGWGSYDPVNHTLSGTRVFGIKLRDSTFRKFMIDSYSNGAYHLRYAMLDGTEEQTVDIAKEDFSGSGIALFSMTTGEALPDPGSFDLLFTRYITPVDDGAGGFLDYPVTGILTGPGEETAQADDVDPETVDFEDYTESLETGLDVIGYDWKAYDFTEGWVMATDVAYFVKTPDDHLWKLVFVDFEGSSTGLSTFEKTDLGLISAVFSPNSNVSEATLFPNPVRDHATLNFTLKENRQNLQLEVRDLQGRTLLAQQFDAYAGENTIPLTGLDWPAGVYFLSLRQGSDIVSMKLIHR